MRHFLRKFKVLFLSSASAGLCDYNINAEVGMNTFYQEMRPGSNICLNISVFDFYFIIGQMSQTTKILQYRSNLHTSQLSLYQSVLVRDVDSVISIPIPYASLTISIGEETGPISFSYGSLPGMCKTGIIFANSPSVKYDILAGSHTYFYDTDNDICIVYTAYAKHDLSISVAVEPKDSVFVYDSFSSFRTLGGKGDYHFYHDGTIAPVVVRYLSDFRNPNDYVSVSLKSDAPVPYKAILSYIDSYNITKPSCVHKTCSFWECINWKAFGILIAVVCAIIIIFGVAYYVSARYLRPQLIIRPQKSTNVRQPGEIWPSDSVMTENRNEPAGYFALDPILRPQEIIDSSVQ